MTLITCWQDIEELGGEAWLTPAEKKLIDACRTGKQCILGVGTAAGELPPAGTPDPDRRVRAELLRYLVLGGCDVCRVRGWGVVLSGAHVENQLDLSFQTVRTYAGLFACRFTQPVVALQTRFEVLDLTGSHLPGLNAQGTRVAGNVVLRRVTATGTVTLSSARIGRQLVCNEAVLTPAKADALDAEGAQVAGDVFLRDLDARGAVTLAGATIGGQLDCEDATFRAADADALNAQGARVTGGAFLRHVSASGRVSLASASIGGQLSCADATFSVETGYALDAQGVQVTDGVFLRQFTARGTVSLSGATIGRQLVLSDAQFECHDGDAVNLQRLRVTQGLFWRGVTVRAGLVDLAAAQVGDLVDDLECWPTRGFLYLDGFTYGRISSKATDIRDRLDWLDKGSTWNGRFAPQPYTQLAAVLRQMGHDQDARQVLAQREKRIRAAARDRLRVEPNGDWDVAVRSLAGDLTRAALWLADLLLRGVVGYGHHPFRSLGLLLALIVLAAQPARLAWEEGSLAPNSGPVLTSQGWLAVAGGDAPAQAWTLTVPGKDWESFNSYAYAADLVIPIIDLGQTRAWSASTNRGPWGRNLWWLHWLFTTLGWIVTALGAAAITGIIRRD